LRKIKKEGKVIEKIGIEKRLLLLRIKEFQKQIKIREENEYNCDIGMSGTSCTLVILKNEFIYHAHVGDSLACLSKIFVNRVHESNCLNDSLILTLPIHTPNNAMEHMRIYNHKGEIRGNENYKIPVKLKPKKKNLTED
jgi:serine/threonine protein phosphatase PrpC